MANTKIYKDVIEPYFINNHVIPRHEGCSVRKQRIALIWGGFFEVDAAVFCNESLQAVYCLSCAEYLTHGGVPGIGKVQKIKADILMLTAIDCPIRRLVFTAKGMYDQILKEQQRGRLPPDISLEHVTLPDALQTLVFEASARAVKEVKPELVFTSSYTEKAFDPASGVLSFEASVDQS